MMKGEDSDTPRTRHTGSTEGKGGPLTDRSGANSAPQSSRGPLLTLVVLVLIAAAIAGTVGVLSRIHASHRLEEYTDANAAPTVNMAQPVLQNSAREIVLPGNVQAFTMAPIYARTTGYVKAWYHDIGAHVRKGELLAVIETPELDQQLAQAKADLATAQSNASLAKLTADRYQGLIAENAVSQQETDDAASQLQARKTEVASAQAAVRRIEELQSFERVEAPFDGVITARNLDIGQLVSSGGSTMTAGTGMISGSKEIFDVAAIQMLRVFINVPQVYAPDAKNGVTATLTLPQYPGRTFRGRLARSSNALDPASRTLLAEVDVDNRSGELLPGSYTEVHLNVSSTAPALIVPVSALILDQDGIHVATVDSNHRAHIVRITPGRDTGTTMEVLNGLQHGQSVITNPPDSLTDGELVRVVAAGDEQSNSSAGGKP